MKGDRAVPGTRLLLAGVFASSMLVLFPAPSQSAQEQAAPEATETAVATATLRHASPYHPTRTPTRAKEYYQSAWGVDNFLVRQTASGNLIRFSYRVTNPSLAKSLGDKREIPYLYGERSQALLQIPVMDKIGQLRQTGTTEAGKEYWMVFSNKGNLVRAGDRVDIIIGSFHIDGLMVE